MFKSMLAAIYARFETRVAGSTDGMEQMDAYLSAPIGDELLIKLREV